METSFRRSIVFRRSMVGLLMAGSAWLAAPALAEQDVPPSPAVVTVGDTTSAFGQAMSEQQLTETRGGTEVINDMTLNGVVAGNQAYNLSTGNNTVTDGAMAGASGMPTLIQNSGNNVLIQNATIVNVQLQ